MDSEKAIKVEYKGEKDFEILVNPDEALKYRQGDVDNFEKVLFVREVFTDARAAERASAADIEDEFGTDDLLEVARKIFEHGKMQLTTDQKNKMRSDKRKQVVSMIARRAMNPKTGSPHPPKRIENALNEAGFNFDPMEPAEKQFDEAIEELRPIIPISLEEKELAIKIPNKYSGKCYSKLKGHSQVLEEQWGNDAFMARVKLPAGAKSKLVEELNHVCHGDLEIKDI